MRKPALASLLLVALLVAGCGGGGASSSGTTGSSGAAPTAGTPAEATWAKEVTAVMAYFENHVSAQVLPSIQDTYNQHVLEPLYRTYGADLGTLANKLAATKAPASCTATQRQIADAAKRVAQLITELSEGSKLSEKQYSLLLERQGEKIHASGLELTELTAKPRC